MLISRSLKCPLTPAELEAHSTQLANAVHEIDALEAKKKEIVTEFKERLDELEARARDLATKVRDRAEYRPIDCSQVHDAKRFIVELYRADTGEYVESRAMDPGEREAALHPKLPGVDFTAAINAGLEVAVEVGSSGPLGASIAEHATAAMAKISRAGVDDAFATRAPIVAAGSRPKKKSGAPRRREAKERGE